MTRDEVFNNVETHFTSTGDMVQEFSNGATLTADKRSGVVITKLGKQVIAIEKSPSIERLEEMQLEAASM